MPPLSGFYKFFFLADWEGEGRSKSMSGKREREVVVSPPQIWTRTRSKQRMTEAYEAFAEAAKQPPVFVVVCQHLCKLSDIMSLARCNKTLYARINQLYPELAALRLVAPKWCSNWPCWFSDVGVFEALIASPVVHPVVFRHCIEASQDAKRPSIRSIGNLVPPGHLNVICKAQRWDLLDLYISYVVRWARACRFVEDRGAWEIPEVQMVWAQLAYRAVYDSDMSLLLRAVAPLNAYYRDPEVFGVGWYQKAPFVRARDWHAEYQDWCERVVVRRLLAICIDAQGQDPQFCDVVLSIMSDE
jgi:hypothetical protein